MDIKSLLTDIIRALEPPSNKPAGFIPANGNASTQPSSSTSKAARAPTPRRLTPATSSSSIASTSTRHSDSNANVPSTSSNYGGPGFISFVTSTPSTSGASNNVSNNAPVRPNDNRGSQNTTSQTDNNSNRKERRSRKNAKGSNQTDAIDNSAEQTTVEKKPPKDGDMIKVIGLVIKANKERFTVIVEEGPYADNNLFCYNKVLRDPTVPMIPKKTRILLGVKVRCYRDEDDRLIVIWATVLEYTRLTSREVCNAIELLEKDQEYKDTFEEFIKKMYFSWRPFFKSLLQHADKFDAETIVYVLNKVLPDLSCYRLNKQHQSRFQDVIELFAAKDSTFLLRLGQLEIYEHELVKQLAECVTFYTKKLDPVSVFLRRYYSNDADGLLELIDKCCSKGFDPASRTLAAQNFRELPLIPVLEELTGVINKLITSSDDATEQTLLQLEKHLIPNRIDGPWDSAEQFLNVHFRLLREECFASIRNRIGNVRLGPTNYKQVHRDVKVIGYAITEGTIVVQLKYKPHKLRANLMFGNLLCLDVNMNFSNPIWATVQSSDVKTNILAIIVVGVGNDYADTTANDTDRLSADILVKAVMGLIACQDGVMVESPTYYHAFRPVLARLQSIEEEDFPFSSEILLHSVNPQRSSLEFHLGKNMGMDESQRAAAVTSLRDRFSLIQGPPGCGKTFIGKEIIKAMLRSKDREGPILLLSYKNHALDSMLEGCLEFTDKVVRVGGKSISEKLEPYNLHNLAKSEEAKAHFSKEDYKALQDAKRQLLDLENDLKNDAGDFLTEFTAATLLKFLQRSEIGRQQLRTLILKHFRANYAEIINRDIKKNQPKADLTSWSHAEVDLAVTEILEQESNLPINLLKKSLSQWITEADVTKYMPNPQGSLFIQNNLTVQPRKEEEEEEMDEDEMAQVSAERRVGPESRYEFVSISERGQKLYPNLQRRIPNLDVDNRIKEVSEINDVWTLQPEGRYLLLSHWLREWNKDKDEHFARNLDNYRRFSEQVKDLQDDRNISFLKTRDLVACTITGCCLRMNIISRLAPSVVIVEEAAEILESQLIAALPTDVQHVVLIGDHKQLPPQVSHYRLRMKYNLGVSIFERLAMNGYHVSQLRYHRRGPESLCPLFSRFYDSEIVPSKPDPRPPNILQKLGIMYWWTHNAPAQTAAGGMSFENELEAAMLVGAIQFLIWQGEIKAEQISVITGYLGQTKLIKKFLTDAKIESVAVSTIDRFQGDENDFIFLSLTRSASLYAQDNSNPPSLGFLASPNRVCVALSRARLGLYIFGNCDLFESHKVWRPTVQYFKSKRKIGTELQFVDSKMTLIFEHPYDFKMFFKKVELEKKEMKIQLQNKYIKDVPPNAREGVHDVTKEFGKRLENLMNDSVLSKRDLGQGRDAHGQKFQEFKVVSVKRIFNKERYFLYLHHQEKIKNESKPPPLNFELDSMADWVKKDVNTKVNEVFLFHGTNETTAKLIAESGFDERLASLGGMFGAGTYFAENADKSDQYSSAAPHMMFLARVILGKPYETTCTGNWRRPPPINQSKPNKIYDSVIAVSSRKTHGRAAVARHQEFVIFDRYQCLPEFLIHYERK